jgi:glucokinase
MTANDIRGLRLVADLGGTNCRAAITIGGVLDQARVVHRPVGNAMEARQIFEECLRDMSFAGPIEAAIAAAGPIMGDRVTLTNGGWSFSVAELKRELGFSKVAVVNDFVGVAMGIPHLMPGDRRAIGGGSADPEGPIAVLGAGTGLGVASLVPTAGGALVLPGEGGHSTVSPADPSDSQIVELLRDDARRCDGQQWLGHVSAERVLSGPGLVNLCRAVHSAAGKSCPATKPQDVTKMAKCGDQLARKTLSVFCAMLGTFAGNLALTLGATGGVFIGGGIVPRFADFLVSSSDFRSRFEQKGRFKGYLKGIPTFLVTHQYPALLGLARMGGVAAGPMLRQPVLARGYQG